MRIFIRAMVSFYVFYPWVALGHDIDDQFFDPAPIISDLDLISPSLNNNNLTWFDVIVVAGGVCTTMRVAQRDLVAMNVAALLNDNYPSADEIGSIEIQDFISSEQNAFQTFNASEATLAYVAAQISASPSIPGESPAAGNSLEETISGLENVACQFRAMKVDEPGAVAPDKEQSLARVLGLAAAGVGLIVVDAKLTVDSAGILTTAVGIASGGWGWNRIEEAYPVAVDLWRSIFQ